MPHRRISQLAAASIRSPARGAQGRRQTAGLTRAPCIPRCCAEWSHAFLKVTPGRAAHKRAHVRSIKAVQSYLQRRSVDNRASPRSSNSHYGGARLSQPQRVALRRHSSPMRYSGLLRLGQPRSAIMRLPRTSSRIAPLNLPFRKLLIINMRTLRFMGRIAGHEGAGWGTISTLPRTADTLVGSGSGAPAA